MMLSKFVSEQNSLKFLLIEVCNFNDVSWVDRDENCQMACSTIKFSIDMVLVVLMKVISIKMEEIGYFRVELNDPDGIRAIGAIKMPIAMKNCCQV